MIYQFSVLFLIGTCISITSARPDCPPICTLEYSPICGTDGVTYSNQCFFNCNRGEATMAYPGECRSKREAPSIQVVEPQQLLSCKCPKNLQPVCASNGVTYDNECLMRCAGADLTVAKEGPCVAE